MNVPEDRSYTDEHEWAKQHGDVVRVGITDFAQDALGDVVFVEVPEVGRAAASGESLAEVESTKSVADIYSPLAGTVAAVNEALADAPEKINTDPYGDGWIFAVEPADADWQAGLLDAAAYRTLIED